MTPAADQVLSLLDERGRITVSEVLKHYGIKYQSVRNAVEALADARQIVRVGKVGTWYIYERPQTRKIRFPKLSASEYPGWRPTGTPADRCRVTVLRTWGR